MKEKQQRLQLPPGSHLCHLRLNVFSLLQIIIQIPFGGTALLPFADHSKEFDFKFQRSITADELARATVTVRQLIRDVHFPFRTFAHEHQSFFPPINNLPCTLR
eukprot:NODE_1528_length_825_cov_12.018625_g1480_i0.p1 GENE.NODE_1528_length_825_cov_12.018625_g1480_i0~~NODE_1528_length_825_cov_12.018625_g1480_i0.p1  ORF type:complete len:104 (+),score=3.18 NODE_1528_length_825_cov_12.018625_g1480_i0:510-821(+)